MFDAADAHIPIEGTLTERDDRRQAADGSPGFDLDLGDLETRSKDELYEIAKRLRIEGRCRMSREGLIEAIREQG